MVKVNDESMVPADRLRTDPLVRLDREQLRQRSSMKWRTYPADVLPLWVAEMDVSLAPTVAEALRKAIDNGDTGYPCGAALAEAVSQFAARHWQWHDLDVSRTALVPDVMLGVVEVLRLLTDRGDAVVVNPPVYAPFYAFVSHDGRRVIAVFADTDLWGVSRLHIEPDREYLSAPTGEVTCCGATRRVRGYPCPTCGGQHCPTCGRCRCEKLAASDTQCRICHLTFRPHLLVEGLCEDCR